MGAGPGELWSRGWSRAACRLSAVHQRCPLPEWGLSPVLPLLSYVNKPCLPPLPSELPSAGMGSQLGGGDGSRWPAVLTHFPRSQCGLASPALVQGEPRRRGGGLSIPSTSGKQCPPHPHGEVCRDGGNWVAISCACGRGDLATWSSGAATVMGRAGYLPQGQWPLGSPVSVSGWTLVSPEAPRGALAGEGGPCCPSLFLAPWKAEGRGPRVPGAGLWCVLCPLPLSLVPGPEPPARGGRCGHREGASQARVWPVPQRPGVVRDRAGRPQPLLRQHHGQRPVGGDAAAKWVPVRLRALPECRVTQIDSAHSALGPSRSSRASGRQADSHPFMSLHPHLGGAWQKPQEGSRVEWRWTAGGPRSERRTGEGCLGS